jgi:Tfp pilus assembly protein PilO
MSKKQSAFNQLMHFWPLVAAVVAIAAAVGASGTKLQQNEENTLALTAQVNAQSKQIAKLEEAVTQLPEMRQDIKEILRRVK